MYKIKYTKTAIKHTKLIKGTVYEKKVKLLIDLIKEDPFKTPPFFEKLGGDLKGLYSRRINIQHRLVYEVHEDIEEIIILSMWSHYEEI